MQVAMMACAQRHRERRDAFGGKDFAEANLELSLKR